ncbi:MAG: hypothetical protein ACFFCQ_12595 [Promethearchaeota archaeon]
MSKDQEFKITDEADNNESYEKTRAAMKESLMDFVGHFSTASAILAGFYIATCAFIISIKAEESEAFAFLDDPLLAEIAIIGDLTEEILATFNLNNIWPTHFEYMVYIFIFLFLLSLISYACFMRASMIQMQVFKADTVIAEEEVLLWLQRGIYALFISLILSFFALPWALLRFLTTHALVLAFLLLLIVLFSLILTLKGLNLANKLSSLIRRKNTLEHQEEQQ